MSPFFEASIKPRFSETDMRGHINNTVIPVWLADGRAALFREELGSKVPTMVVNLNVDFRRELQWGSTVTVRTAVEQIGNSSIRFLQELWQNGQRCVQAQTVTVTLDARTRKPMRVPEVERALLRPYMIDADSSQAVHHSGAGDDRLRAAGTVEVPKAVTTARGTESHET